MLEEEKKKLQEKNLLEVNKKYNYQNREIYYDQLRTLAIIGVICCHVGVDFFFGNKKIYKPNKMFYNYLYLTYGRFIGIPIFIMLSGALLINKNYSLTTFIFKRFIRVFIPYLFWSLIFVSFTIHFQNYKFSKYTIKNVCFGGVGTVGRILWFIWMIMIVYIGIFIINLIIKLIKSKSKRLENIFIHFLFIFALTCYTLFNLGHIRYNKIGYYIFFIPYAIIGYYITHIEFLNWKISKILLITPIKIVIFSFIISIHEYISFTKFWGLKSLKMKKIKTGNYFEFKVIIFTTNIILFFRYLSKCENKLIQKFNNLISTGYIGDSITSISKCSYGIYFIHYLILKYLQLCYLNRIKYYKDPITWTPFLLISVFNSSWDIIWFLSKIPIINIIIGAG